MMAGADLKIEEYLIGGVEIGGQLRRVAIGPQVFVNR